MTEINFTPHLRDAAQYIRDHGWTVDTERDDAGVAAWVLAVRDLIGQRGFTQAHYDTLTAPWRAVFPDFDNEQEVAP